MPKTNLQDCLISVIDNRGVTPHKRGTEWSDSGIPVYSANNVKTSGLQKTEDIRFVPEEIYPIWMKQPLEKGDILLTSEAPAGEVYYWDSDEKIIVGQRLYGLKVKKDINSKYLKYYLQSSIGQKAIQSQQSGSTVFGISAKTFPNIVVNLPDRKKQDKIADLLYSIDKKIDINNRINSELEYLAKTIYDYWFLQFEFPNEEGKPYKSSGGKMVWNDELKREIPEGWRVGNLINNSLCSTIKNGVEYFEIKNYLPTANINGEAITDGNNITFENRESRANMQPTKLSVWFAKMKNSVKHLSIANNGDWFVNKYILSTGFEGLQCTEQSFGYIHSLVNSPYFETHKDTLAHGATQESVNDEDLKNIKFVIPNNDVLEKYAAIVNPLLERKFSNFKQIQELASLRDFLLPMLMNSQVTFKERNIK